MTHDTSSLYKPTHLVNLGFNPIRRNRIETGFHSESVASQNKRNKIGEYP